MDNSQNIKKEAENALKNASNLAEIDEIWREYLGRKGKITSQLRALKDLSEKERKSKGQDLNKLKEKLSEIFKARIAEIQRKQYEQQIEKEWIDTSRPPDKYPKGSAHPITKTLREMRDIFASMGFEAVDGPHIEDEWHNFEALNIPQNHPSRDLWDTFWLKPRSKNMLLRTHTSPVQIRYMQNNNPPFRIIVPGRVFRYEATDASHEIQFYQLEGLMVDSDHDISVASFRAILNEFFSRFFKKDVKTRLRPSYFPFVEPGFEVDINCIACEGGGCSVCSRTGWLEMMGAGMVHPNVYRAAGHNPKNLTGFAFGIGVDRLAMMKYKIDDVRLFYSGDVRFLRQFK